jgi:Glycosyl hydrolases family 16
MGRMLAVLLVWAALVSAPTGVAWPLTIEPPPVVVQPSESTGGPWRLTFSDEFDGTAVDADKWSNGFGWGDLHTKETFSQRYGHWEARMRVASGAGLHSAFWGKPASEQWPPELDVEEIGGVDYVRIWDRPFGLQR